MKGSTLETLNANRALLVAYAETLAELYDRDRDGDDWWHSVKLADGSYADVNLWIDNYNTDYESIRVTAYAVTSKGCMNTRESLALFSKSLTDHQQQPEGEQG